MTSAVSRRVATRALGLLMTLLFAVPAWAHEQQGQAAGFVSGLLHPVSGLDHVLAMVAVGLWGAQLGAPAIWLLPVTFPLVMAFGGFVGIVGGVAGCLGRVTVLPAGVTSLSLLALGIVVALNVRLLPWIAMTVAAAVGFVHGGLNGAAIALAALVLGGVVSLRVPWTRIAVRVAGSWIAAVGPLLLG